MSGNIIQIPEIVVFDLDGKLLSSDATRIWITKQLKSHPLRFITAIAIIPLAILFMKFKKYKILGISIFLWIATYGLTRQQLEENFKTFAMGIKNNSIPNLYWFKEGISELNSHLIEGRDIVIATGSPELLAKELLESIGLNVRYVGIPLKNKVGGWVGGTYCINEEKVNRLKLIGINYKWFAIYTDDIKNDYPILINSKYPYLINADKQKNLSKKLKNMHYLEWH